MSRAIILALLLLAAAIPAEAHTDTAAASAAVLESLLAGAPILLAGLVYGRGALLLARRSRHGGPGHARAGLFALGLLLAALALVGPIPAAAGDSFTAHMIEHELLMVAAAPLLVLSRPLGVLAWGLPERGRAALAATLRGARPLAVLARPGTASLIHGVALWLWHLPAFFQAADRSLALHVLQHASFFGTALLFWFALLPAGRPQAAPCAVSALHLAVTSIHAGALGALFVFAGRLWYPGAVGPTPLGLDPLEDQALAGLVMWVVACAVYVIAALALFGLAIGASGREAESEPA